MKKLQTQQLLANAEYVDEEDLANEEEYMKEDVREY